MEITGREINEDPLSDNMLVLMKLWIEECLVDHKHCSKPVASPCPTRLIDVDYPNLRGDMKLVEGAACEEAKYVAFSHCWGQSPHTSH